ncbi:MAG: MaoC/PaaZ C-terminal domain-containing protein [Actinomycetes bacterium]
MIPRPRYRDIEPGTALPAHKQTLRRADLVRYAAASGDLNTIHWDERAAHDVGLPDVIAHGMLTMGIAMRAVTHWSVDPGAIVSCGCRFARPVVVPHDSDGVEIIVEGTVTEKLDAPRVRVELVVRCGADKVLTRSNAIVALEG